MTHFRPVENNAINDHRPETQMPDAREHIRKHSALRGHVWVASSGSVEQTSVFITEAFEEGTNCGQLIGWRGEDI